MMASYTYKPDQISSKFLTPCRRVGLSRIKKNTMQKSFEALNTQTSIPMKTDKEQEGKQNLLKDETNSKQDVPLISKPKQKLKKMPKKNVKLEERSSDLDSIPTLSKKKLADNNSINDYCNFKGFSTCEQLQTLEKGDQKMKMLENVQQMKSAMKKKFKKSEKTIHLKTQTETNINKSTEIEYNVVDNKSSSSEMVSNAFSNTQKIDYLDKSTIAKNNKMLSTPSGTSTRTKNSSNKFKRTLSMKKSSEDSSCSVSPHASTNSILKFSVKLPRLSSQDLITCSNMSQFNIHNMSNLIVENEKKKKCLEDLKQVEIHKNMYNIDTLNYLTKKWKNKCIAVLNDLLPLVQQHSQIDMGSLLTNLGVSNNLIKLDSQGILV